MKGKEGYGYYPTDFRMILEAMSTEIFNKNSSIMDFGCGKGAALLALAEYGFKSVAGIEYTDSIYETMCGNLEKLGYSVERCTASEVRGNEFAGDKFYCYLGDAASLQAELDYCNNFFF